MAEIRMVSEDLEHAAEGKGKILYRATRTYSATAPDAETTLDVLAALPALGTAYLPGSLALLKSRKVKTVQNLLASGGLGAAPDRKYEAILEYTSDFDPDECEENPTERGKEVAGSENITKLSIGWEKVTETVFDDTDGVPYQTSAGQVSPQAHEVCRPVIRMTKNYLLTDWADFVFLLDYQDKINAEAWKGIPAKCVKAGLELNGPLQENGVDFVEVTWTFTVNTRVTDGATTGWEKQFLDAGTKQLVSGELVPIYENGIPISEPVLLNGAGVKAATGADPEYLPFAEFEEADFTIIP